MPGTKILVCGGRSFSDLNKVFEILDLIHSRRNIAVIIEGGAHGADAMARLWAESRGVHLCTVKALWERYGKAAGPKRNAAMLALGPTGVVAFAGGRGTADMVKQARAACVPVKEVR